MLFMSVPGPSQAGCQSQELALGARQGKAQGLPQAPAMVTNVPLWLHRLETGAQTAGRKEGRKEGALQDKSCSLDSNYGYFEL